MTGPIKPHRRGVRLNGHPTLEELLARTDREMTRDLTPTPCKRSCCWTPYGHAAGKAGCACHPNGRIG